MKTRRFGDPCKEEGMATCGGKKATRPSPRRNQSPNSLPRNESPACRTTLRPSKRELERRSHNTTEKGKVTRRPANPLREKKEMSDRRRTTFERDVLHHPQEGRGKKKGAVAEIKRVPEKGVFSGKKASCLQHGTRGKGKNHNQTREAPSP